MKKTKLNEDEALYLDTIEHLENQVCKGEISNAEFDKNMDTLKNQFRD